MVFGRYNEAYMESADPESPNELEGQATLDDIYAKVEGRPRRLSVPTWQASVRRTLQEIAIPVMHGSWSL